MESAAMEMMGGEWLEEELEESSPLSALFPDWNARRRVAYSAYNKTKALKLEGECFEIKEIWDEIKVLHVKLTNHEHKLTLF